MASVKYLATATTEAMSKDSPSTKTTFPPHSLLMSIFALKEANDQDSMIQKLGELRSLLKIEIESCEKIERPADGRT